MSFGHPWLLLLLPAVWALLLVGQRVLRRGASMRYSGLELVSGLPLGLRARTRWLPIAVRLLAVGLATVAFAQPRIANTREVVHGEGVDIVMVLDISGSMRALDFEPEDRLAVAKRVMTEFIKGRSHDRIGLVVFAAKAFTQCPLTMDYGVLERFLDEVRVGLIEDGTAIGLGIATGVKRLARSEAKSKVLVLLTDGVNNVPTVDPLTAAEAARSLGVKIYAVGVGKEGLAPYPVDHPVLGRRTTQIETHIDEELLTKISQQTGGQYFRAHSSESLERIFKVIDQLERTELETTIFTNYHQLASLFLLPALLLLVADALLSATVYRVLP
jgi:Ca-activated chloride channel family protein